MFSEFFPILKREEGGYSNLGADKGGETYMGITKKNYPNWNGWVIIDSLKPKQGQIIVNAQLEALVFDFYKTNFWDKLKCDSFNKTVAMNLCDFAINSGIQTAAKEFQNTINSLLPVGKKYLIVDGQIGSLTIEAANSLNQKKLNDSLLARRKQFYKNIVNSNPSQNVFLNGWLNRLNSFAFVDEIKKKSNSILIVVGIGLIALILLKIKK
jgi:lysozyme family protein